MHPRWWRDAQFFDLPFSLLRAFSDGHGWLGFLASEPEPGEFLTESQQFDRSGTFVSLSNAATEDLGIVSEDLAPFPAREIET